MTSSLKTKPNRFAWQDKTVSTVVVIEFIRMVVSELQESMQTLILAYYVFLSKVNKLSFVLILTQNNFKQTFIAFPRQRLKNRRWLKVRYNNMQTEKINLNHQEIIVWKCFILISIRVIVRTLHMTYQITR